MLTGVCMAAQVGTCNKHTDYAPGWHSGKPKACFAKRDAEDKQTREDSSPSRDREDVSGMCESMHRHLCGYQGDRGNGGDDTSTKAMETNVQR